VELAETGARSTGGLLAAARTAAGLTLVDLARETRVPVRHLAAIERDDHEGLPALPYATGFVKSYARAVGLDPAALAAQFRSETSKSPHVPTPMALEPLDERRMPARGLAVASLIIVIAVIAGLSAWGSGAFDPPLPNTAAPVVATAPADQPALVEGSNDGAAIDTGMAAIDTGMAAPAPGQAGSADPATPLAATLAANRDDVVLTAHEAVWLKIYDPVTNTVARIGIMAAGERYLVPAQPPGMKLWTGKAGAFDVTVGGRPIPPLGAPVQTVRNLSLAPADLLARASGGAAAGDNSPSAGPVDPAAAPATGPRPIAQKPRPRPPAAAIAPVSGAAPPAMVAPAATPGQPPAGVSGV
jgi:cytoskeletal protein RodZ